MNYPHTCLIIVNIRVYMYVHVINMHVHVHVMCVVSVNCVDRHAEEHPDRVAIIWERDQPGDTHYITYRSASKHTRTVRCGCLDA